MQLAPKTTVAASHAVAAAEQFGTPLYVYDETCIVRHCRNVMDMPNAFGLAPRYAMKANSSRAILQLVASQGLGIDASSLNEARRAIAAGIAPERIMLTTQEVPMAQNRTDLEEMMRGGLRYNVCSRRQLELIADFAASEDIAISMRIHPGVGSGESATRNTGDKYSCFGVHLSILEDVLAYAGQKGVKCTGVHVHIGSGGDPEAWRANIDCELEFVENFFPDATHVSFGGGFKVARMPGEKAADIEELGCYAKKRFEEFYARTGRKLAMEVEPGTYIVANAGFLVTRVLDLKSTGRDGFEFVIVDGGMEVNTRPLLYGSSHPFYVVSATGSLLSSEFDPMLEETAAGERIIVGRCCESGDSQSLDEHGHIVPRFLAAPAVGDYVIVGGCGAYCSAMSPFNYNSHIQVPEVLLREGGSLQLIRRPQLIDQIWQNELGL
ncbi:MAG: diaminopimelate decarboxylase [Lentisphaeria bacterium]|nr:diaminopimelate decarboxylase [Lentisphaeria bacterium]